MTTAGYVTIAIMLGLMALAIAPQIRAWLRYNWQALVALTVAALVFFGMPYALQMVDPTAGTTDAGWLHIIGSGLVGYFAAVFVAFVTLRLVFPSIDDWIDAGGYGYTFDDLHPHQKIYVTTGIVLVSMWVFAKFCQIAAGG